MFRLTNEGKAYVCIQEGLIQGWKEAATIAELCSYQETLDKAPSARLGLQWLGAVVPATVVGDALALIKHYKSFEIMVALFYNPDTSSWEARIPNQHGTGAHVAYDESEDLEVPEGYYFQGTIHSHPNMSAFWSGTDTHDQGSKAGVHLVVGTDSHGNMTSSKASLFYAGKQYDANYAFEFPDTVPEAREDWVARIEEMRKRNTFVTRPAYSFGGSWQGSTIHSTRSGYPTGSLGFSSHWDDLYAGYPSYDYPGASSYRAHATELAGANDDDLSMLVPDMERTYCDNVFAFGVLKSLLDEHSNASRDKQDEITDSLDALFQQAQLELEPSFTAEQAFELARAIASVICPDLAPDIAEAMDPESDVENPDVVAEDGTYYEVYDETVNSEEVADV